MKKQNSVIINGKKIVFAHESKKLTLDNLKKVSYFDFELNKSVLPFENATELTDVPWSNKRFYAFGGDVYYPTGGFHDLIMASSSLEEVKLSISTLNCAISDNIAVELGWCHILDMSTGEIIWEYCDEDPKSSLENLAKL
jgi:hypothetical protein